MIRSILRRATLVAVATILVPGGAAEAQIPDEFTNLKVLDPEIGKGELVGTMRGFAMALGVRCNHCHVGPDDLQGMDFANDEKETKRAARRMLEMSRAINSEYLGNLETAAEAVARQQVGCFTCHRGQPKPPRQLSAELSKTLLSDGAEAAMTRYQELKEQFYGAGVYDFDEGVFGEVARAAFEDERPEAGIDLLRSSIELLPPSAVLHMYLGMALMQTGDAAGAGESFDKVLEIDPGNAGAQRAKMMLERMKASAEGDGG